MMTFNEWLTDNSDFFNDLKNVTTTLSMWDDFNADDLELVYTMTQGSRIMSKNVERYSSNELARVLGIMYNKKWEDTYQAFMIDTPINASSVNTETETYQRDSTKQSDDVIVNQESAYNSSDFINSDGTTKQLNDMEQDSHTKTTEKTTRSIIAVNHRLSLVNKAIMVNVVVEDITKLVALDIY